ncbi:MAG: 3-deoxy-8-phosphooctulonate synthase [Elusimicrobiota bacterium]
MGNKKIKVGKYSVGNTGGIILIAGPCVIESELMALTLAKKIKLIASQAGVPFIFKASFDKANRSAIKSFRGIGLSEGLEVLKEIRLKVGVPVLTDIHEPCQAEKVADTVDIIQIPAFLSRQTDLLIAAGRTGIPVNVKKGQFLSPWDMSNVIDKIRSTGNDKVLLTERGSMFGYNNLVVDIRGLAVMKKTGYPVIYDATHSTQLPGGNKTSSGGQREFMPDLTRAAVAVGIAGVFMEVHENPGKALSDSSTVWPLHKLYGILKTIKRIDKVIKA